MRKFKMFVKRGLKNENEKGDKGANISDERLIINLIS
jgi:hypothetical protein